jgi:hypothetical protein
MKRIEAGILAVGLIALSLAARAAPPVNSCVTADGRTPLYGDDVARGACSKSEPIRELNPDGSPKKLIPAPPTPEQKKQREEEQKQLIECGRLNHEQRHKDEALMDRFPSEDDLQDARYRELGDQVRVADGASQRLKQLMVERADLKREAKFYDPPHQMPPDLKSDREVNDKLAQNELRIIVKAAHEIQRINDKYDADLKRYRELVLGTARMPFQCSNEFDASNGHRAH